MERTRKREPKAPRKLTLTDWTKANDALNLHFEGNKSKLAAYLKKRSRTTITAFFSKQPLSEPEFRKICLALRLNWQEVSAVEEIAPKHEDWIEEVRSRYGNENTGFLQKQNNT